MKRASVVIGANLGDEGKGAAVDALAAVTENPLVVRFNGGAQAGHTVVTPEGKRHVFSHFGSGTFVGAPTYLSKYFIVHPELFLTEFDELKALGIRPKVYVDPDCHITLPSDVMINRWTEEHRNANRHGSCGIGFGETIERARYGLALTVGTAFSTMADFANLIRNGVIPYSEARLARLGVPITVEMRKMLYDPARWEHFVEHSLEFFRQITTQDRLVRLAPRHDIIFEGAQGLMLGQDSVFFPYVTRSHTGITNVLPLAEAAGVDRLDIYYMNRPYLTRHGAGPLEGERAQLAGLRLIDLTNRQNPWQGALRLAPFNARLTRAFINADVGHIRPTTAVNVMLGFSCIDQMDGGMEFCFQAARTIGVPIGMFGIGLTRTHRLFAGMEAARGLDRSA